VRHLLGAELLREEKQTTLARTYATIWPAIGQRWALYGLMQALMAEGRGAQASAASAVSKKVAAGHYFHQRVSVLRRQTRRAHDF